MRNELGRMAAGPVAAGGRADSALPDKRLVRSLARFSAATLVESLGDWKAALPSAIKPLQSWMKACGPAVTVSAPPGDNLMLHRAIYAAQPGDVLMVEVSGHHEAGYWGDVMTHAAMARRLGGLVIDGCVRDTHEIAAARFPVFARGACIRGTLKRGGGTIDAAIVIGSTRIVPGDLVVGDADGVVVIPRAELSRVIERARARVTHEAHTKKELAGGKSTLEMHGWSR